MPSCRAVTARRVEDLRTPALLAFLRGLGMNMSTAEDTKAQATELIGRRATTANEDINRVSARNKQNVTADLKNGVLVLTVPKKPEVQPKKITIGKGSELGKAKA